MSKRKGVSAEEKRQRMLQLFYEKKDFFQLKDLEKLAPKEKGIIAQSVKEVVQCLVDDGLVDSEKIGTSIYFWAFTSKAKHSLKRKVDDLDIKLDHVHGALKKTCEALESAKKGKDECPEREEILQTSAQLEEDKVRILNEIKVYKDSDPEAFEQMKKELQLTKEDINKHTDNIFTFISWCKNKFGYDEGFLYKQFNIPSDLDYIE